MEELKMEDDMTTREKIEEIKRLLGKAEIGDVDRIGTHVTIGGLSVADFDSYPESDLYLAMREHIMCIIEEVETMQVELLKVKTKLQRIHNGSVTRVAERCWW